ncbi:hypothetical protein C4K88_03840 [Arthrobacter pityocampae]|uniref:Uncharacterized protein n=1 Tax=Arthrobacter pityocampae TaxID=547334 RepID=A0A2S5J2G3_9MICC|nr:hypothetical protein [Arthrobacter pityocampae]PPB50994.1 hypothetical protein C4K88_03840 [Arthrobacter pityocampae]
MTPARDRDADTPGSPRPPSGSAPLLPVGARILVGVAAVVFAVSLAFVLAYTTSLPVLACGAIGLGLAGAQLYALRRVLFRGRR